MKFKVTTIIGVLALACLMSVVLVGSASAAPLEADDFNEAMFNKNMDVWFMLMLVVTLPSFSAANHHVLCLPDFDLHPLGYGGGKLPPLGGQLDVFVHPR